MSGEHPGTTADRSFHQALDRVEEIIDLPVQSRNPAVAMNALHRLLVRAEDLAMEAEARTTAPAMKRAFADIRSSVVDALYSCLDRPARTRRTTGATQGSQEGAAQVHHLRSRAVSVQPNQDMLSSRRPSGRSDSHPPLDTSALAKHSIGRYFLTCTIDEKFAHLWPQFVGMANLILTGDYPESERNQRMWKLISAVEVLAAPTEGDSTAAG